MTDNAQSIQIEELVLTLHALIEQQQELLADSQDQGKANNEHVQQISANISNDKAAYWAIKNLSG